MELVQIWKRFKPLQPSGIGASINGLEYVEYKPSHVLSPFIHCFWELSSTNPEGRYHYPIIADGSVDIIIDLKEPEQPLLSVTNDQAFSISLHGAFRYLGVRFFPACIHYFYDLSLKGLTGLTLPIRDVVGKFDTDFLDSCSVPSGTAQIQRWDAHLQKRLVSRQTSVDKRMLHSLTLIARSAGNLRVQQEVAELVSPRHMRRLFEHYTAIGPKKFSQILRFQQILEKMVEAPQREWAQFYYDLGYYDQSHFIREFSHFYGATPSQLSYLNKK